MDNKIEFYGKIRWLITFIAEEIEKIPTSENIKKQVLDICNSISSEVLHNIGEADDEVLVSELNKQLARFHPLIKELENNDNEKMTYMLLITHVADMFALIHEKK